MLTPISEEGNDQNDEEREGEVVVGVAAGGVVGGDEVLSNLSFIFPHVYSTADPDDQPPQQVVGVGGGVVGGGDEGRSPWR